MKYKEGDVVLIDVDRAKKELLYKGPAIVTVANIPIESGFKETRYGVTEEYIIGYATELVKELV